MKKIVLLTTYLWTTTLAGLALHPYRSAQKIIGKKILLPVAIFPLVGLIGFFIIGRILAWLIDVNGFNRELIAGILGTTLIGLLLWQALILVLLFRFRK